MNAMQQTESSFLLTGM